MRFATDENFDGRVLRGLKNRLPEIDIVRVQDTAMYQSPDPELLEWLASENRILLTHDVKTIPAYLYERVVAGQYNPGVIEIKTKKLSIGQVIDELELMIGASTPDEFENQVKYIPL